MRLPWLSPGALIGVETTLIGARFRFERANLYVDFLHNDLARISWHPGKQPFPYAIEKMDWSRVQTSTIENETGWQLESSSMKILVRSEGSLQFISSSGKLLRNENTPVRRGDAESSEWACRVRLRPEECLFGLGEQTGPFNLRGTIHRMWNTDPKGRLGPRRDPIYMPVPVYMSLHDEGSYLVFYENSFPAIFDFSTRSDDSYDSCKITFEGGSLRYYFISGSPAEALRRFTQLTGRPELPPKWSLGYHHSRWGYKNEHDVRQVVAGFISHDMPLSAFHLDIDHMHGYRTLTVDQDRFPEIKNLASDLQKQGVKLVSIVNPGVKIDAEYPVFVEGQREGRFCSFIDSKRVAGVVWPGRSVYPDFTDPKTRNWWGYQYRDLITSEIAGFWHDMNEPTSFTLWGDMDLPLGTRHKMDGAGGDHRQGHNLYALLMNRAGHEALREMRPDRRPWLLSRSGWVSQQRYSWNWTGDIESSWEALKMTIATVLGQGLSGLPYTGPDIGGFSGDPNAELYLRWFQMATFLPFFRTHSAITTARREPWVYGEPYTDIIRSYLKFRYKLMPYLYSLAWQTSQTGLPMVRPLFWLDPSDRSLWDIEDSFLLGDCLLVAPILHSKEQIRQLRLPHGSWYSWWDDTVYQGPASIDFPVSLEHIPLLVRSGSLIPLEEAGDLHLHVFPPDPGEQPNPLILYNDSGDGYGFSRLDRIQLETSSNNLKITWQGEGEYPFIYNKIYIRVHAFQAKIAYIDDHKTELKENMLETKIFDKIVIEK